MFALIPGHHVHSLAHRLHFSIPWCPLCSMLLSSQLVAFLVPVGLKAWRYPKVLFGCAWEAFLKGRRSQGTGLLFEVSALSHPDSQQIS